MHTYSVSEFTATIETNLKERFSSLVKIEGEISNFKASSNGHWYFTLKDDASQIQAVMFRGSNTTVPTAPHNGDSVLIVGEVAFYKARGQCQIICSFLTQQGIGAILAKLDALKKKCMKEGLFDTDKKKPLPPLPRTIGIITSRNAAALEDIKRTIHNNGAKIHAYVFHCAVQGDTAAQDICTQIRIANAQYPYLDALLISRGGGSLEDLLPFSDERVIRAVTDSVIPVISGVGHEIDVPLCELAADIRAHTPTDAAEIICKTIQETEQKVQTMRQTLRDTYTTILQEYAYLIQQFKPQSLIQSFFNKTSSIRQTIDHYTDILQKTTQYACKNTHGHIKTMVERLHASSPKTILSQGYALVYDKQKTKIYTSAQDLPQNTHITIALGDGEKDAIIQ